MCEVRKGSRFRGLSQDEENWFPHSTVLRGFARVDKGKAIFEYVVTTIVYGRLTQIWNFHAFMIARINDSAHRKIMIKWMTDLFPWCAAADVHVPSQLQVPAVPGALCLFDVGLFLGQSNQRRGTPPSAAGMHQRHAQARCAMAIKTPLAISMFLHLRSWPWLTLN